MKKLYMFLGASALVAGLSLKGLTNASQPPVAHTGAPGDMDCSHCHGPVNSGSGSVTLLNPPANYVPGTSYPLQVKVTDASRTRFGFEMVALRSGNAQAGTFTLTSTANTVLLSSGGKSYVGHKGASSNSTWNVTWNAPATDVGPVTFYMAGNAANGNGGADSNDRVYLSTITLSALVNGIQEDKAGAISMYPNPASEKMYVAFPEKISGLKVMNVAGKEVLKAKALETALDVSNLPNGVYFLQLDSEKTSLVKRFVVQH